MNRMQKSHDLGNGVRPRHALGVEHPIWRLGALVSLLNYSIGKVMMVQRPDRSSLLKQIELASCTRRENVSSALLLKCITDDGSTKNQANRENLARTRRRILWQAIPRRRRYGYGPCRQGIARHVPPCPAALHLDCPALRQDAPQGIACQRIRRRDRPQSRKPRKTSRQDSIGRVFTKWAGRLDGFEIRFEAGVQREP